MVTIVALVVLGAVAIFVGRPMLAARARRLEARDARQARLEAARTSEDVVQALMLDREMAEHVRDGLDRELKKFRP